MQAIVTGATGILGRKVVGGLLGRGTKISLLGTDKARLQSFFSGGRDIGFYDLSDLELNRVPFSSADVVLHCAFSRSQEGRDLVKSIDFSRHVFEKACAEKSGAIVNISSQSLYGAYRPEPSLEGDVLDPIDKYAVAKYTTELLLAAATAGTKTRYTNIRLSSLIGEGMDERLVTKFVAQAMQGLEIRIEGGAQRFSFLDVEDAADALVVMLCTDAAQWKPCYNLGHSESYTISEIAAEVTERVWQQLKRKSEVTVHPKDIRFSALLDTSLFARDFGWSAKISLGASIENIIKRKSVGV